MKPVNPQNPSQPQTPLLYGVPEILTMLQPDFPRLTYARLAYALLKASLKPAFVSGRSNQLRFYTADQIPAIRSAVASLRQNPARRKAPSVPAAAAV